MIDSWLKQVMELSLTTTTPPSENRQTNASPAITTAIYTLGRQLHQRTLIGC